jgi:hypothetical protein
MRTRERKWILVYGLPVYLDVPVELMSRTRQPPAYRSTVDGWEEEIAELGRAPYRHLYLVRGRALPALERGVEGRSVVCQKVAGLHQYHLLVCEPPRRAGPRRSDPRRPLALTGAPPGRRR